LSGSILDLSLDVMHGHKWIGNSEPGHEKRVASRGKRSI